jgi:threonine/homoserine/homoserine lactone efflux protein
MSQLQLQQQAGLWDPTAQPINPLTLLAWQAGVPMFRTDMSQTVVRSCVFVVLGWVVLFCFCLLLKCHGEYLSVLCLLSLFSHISLSLFFLSGVQSKRLAHRGAR